MAAYSVSFVKTATLAASTVDSITLTGPIQAVEIVHQGNVTNPIYVLVDDAVAAPTVAGDNCEVVLSNERCRFSKIGSNLGSTVVSIISAGTVTYTVVGVR